MVLLNGTRFVSLLENSHRSMILIMRTFALVTKMPSIRTLIALTIARRWPLYQSDVKNVFLNNDLSQVVICILLLVLLFHLDMYAVFDELFMV